MLSEGETKRLYSQTVLKFRQPLISELKFTFNAHFKAFNLVLNRFHRYGSLPYLLSFFVKMIFTAFRPIF